MERTLDKRNLAVCVEARIPQIHLWGVSIYNAAHNDERAIALYERAQDALELTRETPLDAKTLRVRLLRVAQTHNLALDLDYLHHR